MRCYRSIPQHKPITRKILAVAASTAIMGAAVVAPFSNFTVHAEALPDVAGAAATTVGQYLYSIFAASGNSLANHEVNTAMMTELSITMQDLAEEGIITLQGQVYDPNDQEQINEVIQAFGQRTGDIEVNVAQFAQRIQALDSAQTARLEQAAFSLDKLETDPNLSYPDYFVYFSYALAGYLEAGMIEGARLYEIVMNASDNVILTLDDIHDCVIDFYSDLFASGASIATDFRDLPDQFNLEGYSFRQMLYKTDEYRDLRTSYLYCNNPDVIIVSTDSSWGCVYLGPDNTGSTTWNVKDLTNIYYSSLTLRDNTYSFDNYNSRYKPSVQSGVGGLSASGGYHFSTRQQQDDFVNGLLNGNPVPLLNVPDLINQTAGNYNIQNKNGTAPAINADEGLLPIPTADIAPFEQAVADNNAQQLYPDNAYEAELLINPYIVPNTAPGPAPEPGYNPIPDQPTIPEKDPISSEQEQTNLGGATAGLEDIFPFCIPFDVARIFTAFEANRRAPSLHVPLDQDGNYLDVDLEDFEDAAALLRLLELIAFVVGLALAARALIGARG